MEEAQYKNDQIEYIEASLSRFGTHDRDDDQKENVESNGGDGNRDGDRDS